MERIELFQPDERHIVTSFGRLPLPEFDVNFAGTKADRCHSFRVGRVSNDLPEEAVLQFRKRGNGVGVAEKALGGKDNERLPEWLCTCRRRRWNS